MATSLNLRVLDVNYAPLKADKAQAMFDHGAYADAPAGQEEGVYTLPVADDVQEIAVRVIRKNYYDATQQLVVNRLPGKPVPSLEYREGRQEINTRNLRVTRIGDDVRLDVYIVLGQLADATDRAREEAGSYGIDLGLKPALVRRNKTPFLDATKTGPDAIPPTKETIAPAGRLVFAERKTVPKLIAVYLPPDWCFPVNPYKDPVPGENQTDYRVFFHPYIPWGGPYPYGKDYLDLVLRYLLLPWDDDGKTLIHQQEACGSQRVLVFPVGAQGKQMGDLSTQASMLRLLQEINYWAQRMDGVSYPIHTVGTCALSGFSGGIDFVSAIVGGKGGADKVFYKDVLTDLYVFDGVSNTMATKSCCDIFRKWFLQGGRSRTLRIYTQSAQWWNEFKDIVPVPVSDPGQPPGLPETPALNMGPPKSNSMEAHTSASTVLRCPANKLFVPNDYWWAHQYIPARFMEHAADHSVTPA